MVFLFEDIINENRALALRSFIYLFNKYLLNINHIPTTMLSVALKMDNVDLADVGL